MKSISSKILDGRKLRNRLTPKLIESIRGIPVKPKLVIVQIGNQKGSSMYIRKKKLFARTIGALVVHKHYSKDVSEENVISDIMRYNSDSSIHGIMVQLPIPAIFNASRIIEAIDQKKDVDGLTAKSMKLLIDNHEGFIPAALKGILTLLQCYRVSLPGKKVVIVGDSLLIARPAVPVFLNRGAIVTICHPQAEGLEKETKLADVLIVAADQPHLVALDHVSKRHVVIDAGATVVRSSARSGTSIVGDVEYKKVKTVVSAISPVPGGIGPMIVFSLFENLVTACQSFTCKNSQ